jgi:hypothetical protein
MVDGMAEAADVPRKLLSSESDAVHLGAGRAVADVKPDLSQIDAFWDHSFDS